MILSYTRKVGKWTLGPAIIALALSSCDKEAQTAAEPSSADQPKSKAQVVDHVVTPPAPAASDHNQAKTADENSSESTAVAAVGGDAKSEGEESAQPGFEVVTDPATIQVEEGMPRPKVGDKIYTFTTLPKEACGTYWVKDSDGSVAQVAICNDKAHSH